MNYNVQTRGIKETVKEGPMTVWTCFGYLWVQPCIVYSLLYTIHLINDINLRRCVLHPHKLWESHIATYQKLYYRRNLWFCCNMWSRPRRGKLNPTTPKTCSMHLGEYPCRPFTWIWEVQFSPIFALFVYYMYCIQSTKREVIMGTMASQISSLTIVYSTFYSGADQRKHQSSAWLAFAPVNSPHKWPVTRKMFPFDYVIM